GPYGTVLRLSGGTSENTFKNVTFRGMQLNNNISDNAINVVGESTNNPQNLNYFIDCSFLYGTKGLQLFGPSISSLSTGNMVSGCQFFNQYFNFAHIKNQR